MVPFRKENCPSKALNELFYSSLELKYAPGAVDIVALIGIVGLRSWLNGMAPNMIHYYIQTWNPFDTRF